MGNNNVTPMTRSELKKARFHIPENFVEEITNKIWYTFGEMQQNRPDLKTWRVVVPIDVDSDIKISKRICKDISKQIVKEYVSENYPYDIISVDLCTVNGEYHIACIFQEESTDNSEPESEPELEPEPESEPEPEPEPEPELEPEPEPELELLLKFESDE